MCRTGDLSARQQAHLLLSCPGRGALSRLPGPLPSARRARSPYTGDTRRVDHTASGVIRVGPRSEAPVRAGRGVLPPVTQKQEGVTQDGVSRVLPALRAGWEFAVAMLSPARSALMDHVWRASVRTTRASLCASGLGEGGLGTRPGIRTSVSSAALSPEGSLSRYSGRTTPRPACHRTATPRTSPA